MNVSINEYIYTIDEVDELEDIDDKMIIGDCQQIKQKIRILKSLPYIRKRNTLRHELCHAFIDAFGLARDVWGEEEICSFVETYGGQIEYIVNEYFDRLDEGEKERSD